VARVIPRTPTARALALATIAILLMLVGVVGARVLGAP